MRQVETQFGLDIDVSEFVELAGRSAGAVERAGKRALNNIAFDLKKATPQIIDELVDRPTPFTRSPSAIGVHRASSSEEGAILYINSIQSQYLGNLEYGGVKHRGIRGTKSAGSRATDKYGNVRGLWRRNGKFKEMVKNERIKVVRRSKNANGSLKRDRKGKFLKSTSDYTVGRYFIGRLKNGRNPRQVGLWERGRNNESVRMISEFVLVQRYTTPLGLHKEWQKRYDNIYREYFYNAMHYELTKARRRRANAASPSPSRRA